VKELKQFKNYILLILLAGLVAFTIVYAMPVWQAIMRFVDVLTPFLIGAIIAFVLGIPINFLERTLLFGLKQRLRRLISISITLIAVLGLLSLIVVLIIPQLIETFEIIIKKTPGLYKDLVEFLTNGTGNNSLDTVLNNVYEYIRNSQKEIMDMVRQNGLSAIGSVSSILLGVFGGFMNAIIGTIFAIMALFSKETLMRQAKTLLLMTIPKKTMQILKVCDLSATICERFVAGQIIEALIAGVASTVFMLFVNPHYAVLIGVLMMFCALIPVIGVPAGTAIAALLLLTANPFNSLAIIIFTIIFQQIDNNFIYPNVVGKSIGLPAIWVLVSIMVGVTLLGVVGVLLAVPVCAVLYTLLGMYAKKKVKASEVETLNV
jgi:predicted PurR-regulated permease PerM